jgi:N-acetylneuraminate synthase
MSKADYRTLVNAIKENGCIPMSTPFDEASVDLCAELDLPIIKIQSADVNDWPLIERIAKTKKPVIFSTGGASLKDMDDLVKFFTNRNIPIAVNHCVSIYPSEERELELNQIDFLKNRFPDLVIGFSSHEYRNWHDSMMIAYAKGARTFERHIDIDADGIPVSPYCSSPENVDTWFKAYNKAKEMCGAPGTAIRNPPEKEIKYLDALVRGVYARRDLPKGYVMDHSTFDNDFYMAIPLQKGQLSCREVKNGEILENAIQADDPVKIDDIDSPYARVEYLKKLIYERGI